MHQWGCEHWGCVPEVAYPWESVTVKLHVLEFSALELGGGSLCHTTLIVQPSQDCTLVWDLWNL